MIEDNDGWIIKCKPSQTKFEVAMIGNFLFRYEHLKIMRDALSNLHKLLAHFMFVDLEGLNEIVSDDSNDISSLILMRTLMKLQIPNTGLDHVLSTLHYERKGNMYHKLVYHNDSFTVDGILTKDTTMKAMMYIKDFMKYHQL
jgi:hypothetical protein